MKVCQLVVLAAVTIMSLATLTEGATDRDDAVLRVPRRLLGRNSLGVAQLTGSDADGAGGSVISGVRHLLNGPDKKPDTPNKPAEPKTATSGSTPYERTMAYAAKMEQERAKAPASSAGSPSAGSDNSGTSAADSAGSGASSADGAGGSANTGARHLLNGPDLKPETPEKPKDPTTATSGATPYDRTMAYASKVEQKKAKAPASSGGAPSSSAAPPSSAASPPSGGK